MLTQSVWYKHNGGKVRFWYGGRPDKSWSEHGQFQTREFDGYPVVDYVVVSWLGQPDIPYSKWLDAKVAFCIRPDVRAWLGGYTDHCHG